MNSKRWLLGFLATAVVLGAAVLGFNWLVDPFGVFSHKALEWPSYEMTMNPPHCQNHLSQRAPRGVRLLYLRLLLREFLSHRRPQHVF